MLPSVLNLQKNYFLSFLLGCSRLSKKEKEKESPSCSLSSVIQVSESPKIPKLFWKDVFVKPKSTPDRLLASCLWAPYARKVEWSHFYWFLFLFLGFKSCPQFLQLFSFVAMLQQMSSCIQLLELQTLIMKAITKNRIKVKSTF